MVECPNDPPCFDGYWEVPKEDATFIRLDKDALLQAMIRANALKQSGNERYAVPSLDFLGIKEIREQRLFAYLATDTPTADHFQQVNAVVKTRDEHAAVILTPCEPKVTTRTSAFASNVLLQPLPDVDEWDFTLIWFDLADAADPTYITDRHKNGEFVYEDVSIHLATDPGKRHIVTINSFDCRGFAKSDARFSRLLYLAACRKADPDVYFGGWVDRAEALLDDKGKHLGQLRDSLRKTDYCGLEDKDLAALIKTNPEGDGTVRLAIHPTNIHFDPSLQSTKTVQNIRSSNHKRHTDDLKKSLSEARVLYRKAQDLIC